jgi:hypothetical protein
MNSNPRNSRQGGGSQRNLRVPRAVPKRTGGNASRRAVPAPVVNRNPVADTPASTSGRSDPPTPLPVPRARVNNKFSSALLAARTYAPGCNKESETWKRFLKMGITPREDNNDNLNPHQLSASLRSIATVQALGRLYDAGARKVVDIYGSPRTITACEFLNKRIHQPLELSVFRPFITSKDFGRHINDPRMTCSGNIIAEADAYLCYDVYEDFTPAKIFALYKLQKRTRLDTVSLIWVGRCFYGDVAEHEDGFWYRGDDNKINFFQDAVTSAPYVHDACDWLWNTTDFPYFDDEGERIYLTWDESSKIGSIRMISFTFTKRQIAPQIPQKFENNLVHLEAPDCSSPLKTLILGKAWPYLPGFLIKKLFTKKISLYRPAFDSLISQYSSEKIKSYNLGRIAKDYQALVSSPQIQMMIKHVSGMSGDPFECAYAILYRNLEMRKNIAIFWHVDQGDNAAEYNEMTGQSMGTSPNKALPQWGKLISMILAVLGFLKLVVTLFKRMRISFASLTSIYYSRLTPTLSTEEALLALIPSPFFEEAFKRGLGKFGALFGPFEFACRWYMQGSFPYNAIPALMLHEVCRRLPFNQGWAVHFGYNLAVVMSHIIVHQRTKPANIFSFREWKKRCYEEDWTHRYLPPADHTSVEPFEPRDSAFPTSTETNAPIPPQCQILKIKGELPFLEGRNPTFFYNFLPTQIPGYVPAITDANLAAAVRYRILAQPPMDPFVQKENWIPLRQMIPDLVRKYPRIIWQEEKEKWLDHFEPRKKKKYIGLLQRLSKESWTHFASKATKTPVFMKSNEMLFKIEGDFPHRPGQCQLKPRVIINVAPEVQTIVGPSIWRAQQNLKKEWPMDIHYREINKMFFSLSYAGAATDAQLSSWFQKAVQGPIGYFHIIISGDDSLVIVNIGGEIIAFEGDATMYDQSESFGPLQFGWDVCSRLGVGRSEMRVLKQLACNTYLVESKRKNMTYKRCYIDKTNRPLRDTGGADTSLGNSVVMGGAWVWVLLENRMLQLNGIKESFAFLGLKMKLKAVSPYLSTFLKGMWYEHEDGPYWAPLMSRVFKVGKCLKDPRQIYGVKDLSLAASMFLSDVANSYAVFSDVPILRKFVKNFNKHPFVHNQLDFYQVKGTMPPRRFSELAWWQIEARYNVTKEDVLEAEKLFPSVPFVFSVNPVYDCLIATDN